MRDENEWEEERSSNLQMIVHSWKRIVFFRFWKERGKRYFFRKFYPVVLSLCFPFFPPFLFHSFDYYPHPPFPSHFQPPWINLLTFLFFLASSTAAASAHIHIYFIPTMDPLPFPPPSLPFPPSSSSFRRYYITWNYLIIPNDVSQRQILSSIHPFNLIPLLLINLIINSSFYFWHFQYFNDNIWGKVHIIMRFIFVRHHYSTYTWFILKRWHR